MQAMKSKGAMLDQIDLNKVPRSGFDMSYHTFGTGTLGRLIPIRKVTTIPGDRWQGKSDINVNFQPLAYPMSANMYMKQETFYVPHRILWKGWEEHWTKGEDLSVDTQVPSFSLQKLMKAIINPATGATSQLIAGISINYSKVWTSLENPLNPSLSYVNPDGTNSEPFTLAYIDVSYPLAHLQAIKDKLMARSERFETLDLIQPTIYAIDSMTKWINDNYWILDINNEPDGNIKVIPLTYIETKQNVDEAGNITRDVYPIGFPKNGVVEDYKGVWSEPALEPLYGIIDYIGNKLVEDSPNLFPELDYYNYYQYVTLPSSEFITFARLYYKVLQQFLGTGSYLDYLGYQCIQPEDILASLFTHYVYNMALSKESSDWDETFPFIQDSPTGFTTENEMLGGAIPFLSTREQSILRLRANYAIWYWNYRDQLIELKAPKPTEETVITDDELFILSVPRLRAWTKDTFTTALDNTGTGSVVVSVNNDAVNSNTYKKLSSAFIDIGEQAKKEQKDIVGYRIGDTSLEFPTSYIESLHDVQSGLSGSKYGFSLDMLTRAKRLQKWIQKALIYGNRPEDAYFTHYGVRIKQSRIQEPEYVTSDTSLVSMGVVMNNTTTAESVAGDKTGNAFGNMEGSGINHYCEEHGTLITMFSIMPEATYGFGVDKENFRLDTFDIPFPEFAQLSMDAVYTDELVTSSLHDSLLPCKTEVFGYQGRYYDHKSKQDEIHGDYRTDQMLGYTFARHFSPYTEEQFPRLNYAFIHCYPRRDMFVVADPSEDIFWFDCLHSQALERTLPVPSQVF